jgi:hypothetical protein
MKDVKITNKIANKKTEQVSSFFSIEKKQPLVDSNRFLGQAFFVSMISVFVIYLFFVTSSIFYAINTQKYSYEIELLGNAATEVGYNLDGQENPFEFKNISKKDKITYVNRNAETAISLK